MPSKYEKRAKEELVGAGWRVDTKWGMHRYSKNNDYFTLFDLMAHKEFEGGAKMRFISIKGRAGVPSDHKEEIAEFKLPESCRKEIWSRSKAKTRDYYWNKYIWDKEDQDFTHVHG